MIIQNNLYSVYAHNVIRVKVNKSKLLFNNTIINNLSMILCTNVPNLI